MKVSVLIPVHNGERVLGDCLRSLKAQRDVDLECVFADDASSDGTFAALERGCGELTDAGIAARAIRLPRNGGTAAARLEALRHATGDYVGFCDADDWVEPDCYAKLLAAIERDRADLAMCAYCDVSANGVKSPPRRARANCAVPAEFIAKSFYSPGFNSLCNKLFRADLARKWLEDRIPNFCVGEDLVMTLRFLVRAERLAFVDEPLYCYRKTASSVSNEVSPRTVRDMAACVRFIRAEFPSVPDARLDIVRAHLLWLALRCRELDESELKELFREQARDFSRLDEVPRLKRLLLPVFARHLSLGGILTRLIETARRSVR